MRRSPSWGARPVDAPENFRFRVRLVPYEIMNHDSTTTLDRLLALFTEAEQVLPQAAASEDLRDAFAIVRGYLDLGRMYGEPVNIDDLERMMARIANFIGDASFQKRFLTQLRTVTAWSRLSAAAVG